MSGLSSSFLWFFSVDLGAGYSSLMSLVVLLDRVALLLVSE